MKGQMSMTVLYKDGQEKAVFFHQLEDHLNDGWSLEPIKAKDELDKKAVRGKSPR